MKKIYLMFVVSSIMSRGYASTTMTPAQMHGRAMVYATGAGVCMPAYPHYQVQCEYRGQVVHCDDMCADSIVTTCYDDIEEVRRKNQVCIKHLLQLGEQDDCVHHLPTSVKNIRRFSSSHKNDSLKNRVESELFVCVVQRKKTAPVLQMLFVASLLDAVQDLDKQRKDQVFKLPAIIDEQPFCSKNNTPRHEKRPKTCKQHGNYYR